MCGGRPHDEALLFLSIYLIIFFYKKRQQASLIVPFICGRGEVNPHVNKQAPADAGVGLSTGLSKGKARCSPQNTRHPRQLPPPFLHPRPIIYWHCAFHTEGPVTLAWCLPGAGNFWHLRLLGGFPSVVPGELSVRVFDASRACH